MVVEALDAVVTETAVLCQFYVLLLDDFTFLAIA